MSWLLYWWWWRCYLAHLMQRGWGTQQCWFCEYIYIICDRQKTQLDSIDCCSYSKHNGVTWAAISGISMEWHIFLLTTITVDKLHLIPYHPVGSIARFVFSLHTNIMSSLSIGTFACFLKEFLTRTLCIHCLFCLFLGHFIFVGMAIIVLWIPPFFYMS